MILILSIVFIIFLLLGSPIMAAMGLSTWASMITNELPSSLVALTGFDGLNSFTLLSIPLFLLAGEIMDKGGISSRLMNFVIRLVGSLPGGLGIAVVFASMLFSGLSGSVNADAAAIGSLMIPSMEKAGYRKEYASAIVAAAAGTGILIPPSITMIILGTIANLSIKELFLASLLPAAVIGISKALIIWYRAKTGIEKTNERILFSFKDLMISFLHALPSLLAPIIILGGIITGVFTATESAVIAVLYSTFLACVVYRELTWKHLQEIAISIVRSTGIVVGLIATATGIAYLMAYSMVSVNLGNWIGGYVNNYFIFITILIILFWILGAVMDGIPALVILIPVFMPLAVQAGMDPIHFAIFSLAVFGVSLVSPPLGTACFVVAGIAKIEITALFKPIYPFMIVMFATVLLLAYVPWFSLFIPSLFHK
ncbi:MAG: TRAP transporter large permease [Paenibacillaceae bacterium]